ELTGLTPNTAYHFRVGNGESWCTDLDFKTGNMGDHATFFGIGDSQHNRADRAFSARQMSKVSTDFAIFTGDLVESGLDALQWTNWFYDFRPFLNEVPFMSVLGNHEKNSSLDYTNFALPGKEEYYSFNYGPIHFVALHSCVPDYSGTFDEQIDWLHADLQAHNDYAWKIVFMHRPAFASSPSYHLGYYDDIQTLLVPIFEQYKITVVITGHVHFYERLINNNITYVITGSVGAPLADFNPAYRINQSIFGESTYHFTLMDVYPNQLDFRAFRMDYSLLDEFTFNKEDKPDLRVEVVQNKYSGFYNETKEIKIRVTNIGEQNISETTAASIESDFGVLQTFDVPALDVRESFEFQYDWSVSEPGAYKMTINIDINDIIDEIGEGNNEIVLSFIALEIPKKTSYTSNLIMIVSFVLMLMIPVIKRRRKNN
ncbi:MAG: metallophosphoesterase, partial [Candidatus Heimdallarchaeaceae archaeon]